MRDLVPPPGRSAPVQLGCCRVLYVEQIGPKKNNTGVHHWANELRAGVLATGAANQSQLHHCHSSSVLRARMHGGVHNI